MLMDGLELYEGSVIDNLGVPIGTSFPSSPNYGELFYRSDEDNLYIYATTGSTWVAIAKGINEISKWLIDTADKIYHIDDVAIGTTPTAGKKLYVLGDSLFDGAVDVGSNAITSTFVPLLAEHVINKLYADTTFVADGVWQNVVLENSWLAYGASYNPPQYRKIGTNIELRGRIKDGVIGSPVFTLPIGYRSLTIQSVASCGVNAFAQINIDPTGTVDVGVALSNTWVSLDGVIFSIN